MIDPYGTLLQMSAQPEADPVKIAQATGWPLDAVQTLLQELEVHQPIEE